MRLLELELFTPDLRGQEQFFRDVLQQPTTRHRGTLQVQIGASRLTFRIGAPAGPYHLAFDVPGTSFGAAHRWIRERAELLSQDGQDRFHSEAWNADSLYFPDTDHNILELIARHTVDRTDPEAFTPAHLLNVSEIGVAVPDLPAATARIRETLGVGPYLGGAARFQPTGTHHGLFIVVEQGRPWFPTARPALPLPLRVVAQTPRRGVVELASGPVQISGVVTP